MPIPVVRLRPRLLSSTCLTALTVLALGEPALAQSVVINDARVVPQNLDTLLPPASPKTAAITNTGSVIVTSNNPAVVANTSGWTLGNSGTVINTGINALSFGIRFDQGGTITNNNTGWVGGFVGMQIDGQPGVVTNSGLITGLTGGSTEIGNGLRGIILNAGGTVTNNADGTITAAGGGVEIKNGGTVTNAGTITSSAFNAVRVEGGGVIVNQQGAVMQGNTSAAGILGGGTITNAGTMIGTGSSDAVLVQNGGVIINTSTGIMQSNASTQTASIAVAAGTISNAGTITNNGTGNFSAGAAVSSGGTISNQAGGFISAKFNGVWINNPGTLENAGLIQSNNTIAGAAAELSRGGVVVNSGTLIALGNSEGIFMGGTNQATQNGTITNRGTIGSALGPTAISLGVTSHTLNLDTGSVINGNVLAGGGAGVDAWNLLGTGSETLGKFQQFETFAMKGTEWTVTGSGTIGTSSAIETGILRVNGTLTTPTLNVLAPGTLAGSGTVVGTVTNAAGTLAPGSQTTVLSIQGNLTMGVDSTYRVLVDPTNATRTNVVGMGNTATLQGGQVEVNVQSGTFLANTEYLILHADGGVVGSFDPTVPQQGNFRFSLRQDEDDVFLTLLRFAFNDPSICATRNQCAVGTGLENVAPTATGDLLFVINTLGGLDFPDQRRALGSMAGDQHATLAKLALEGNALFGQSITRRLAEWRNTADQTAGRDRATQGINIASLTAPDEIMTAQLRPGPARSDGYGVWLRGYGVFGTLDDDGNAAGAEYDIGGAALGIDRQFTPNFIAGLSFGYAHTSADFDREGADMKIDSYDFGLYAGWRSGGFRADAVLSYAYLDNDTSRNVLIGPISRTAKADYDGHRIGAGLDLGYSVRLGLIEIEPQASLHYIHLRQDSFKEKGAGGVDLDVDAATVESLRSGLGVRLAAAIPLGLETVAVPELRARWQHEFLDERGKIDAQFVGEPASAFAAQGVKTPRDSAILGAGMAVQFSNSFSAFVDYDMRLNENETVHNVSAGLRMTW